MTVFRFYLILVPAMDNTSIWPFTWWSSKQWKRWLWVWRVQKNGNSRTSNMSCSVRGFCSHLVYVDKHPLPLGQRNPNMETLITTLSVKGKGPVVLVTSETEILINSNTHQPEPLSLSILKMPNGIICITQWLKTSQGSIWLSYTHLRNTVTVRGQSSLQLEPKSNALEI